MARMDDWGGTQRYTLEFIRPHTSMNATDRWMAAYPGLEYNVRAGVIGGVYPYLYELVNPPDGMTINAETGEISWPDPQSDASNIQITVTDTKGTSVTSVAWSIDVASTRFKFFAPSGSGGSDSNTGAIDSPWLTLAKHKASSGTTGIGIFRAGTYDMTGLTESSEGIRWGTVASSPSIFLAYPGDEGAAIFDFQGLRWDFGDGGASPRVYLDGVDLWRGGNKTIRGFSNNDLVIRRCKGHDFGYPDGGLGSSNSALIMWESGGHTSGFWARHVYQDNEFYDQIVAAVNGANCVWKLYSVKKWLAEDNYLHHCDPGDEDEELIANKAGTSQGTIRGNRSDNCTTGIYGGNHNPAVQSSEGYCDFELCFNNFQGSGATTVHLNYNLTQNIACYSYRNTIRGGVRIRDLSATDGPYNFNNDVIINENSGNPAGSHITQETVSDISRLVRTDVLAGNAADGYVDANGLLTGQARTDYLGLRGHELEAAAGLTIEVGDDWQAKVDANAEGAIFTVAAGTHRHQFVTPKTGQEFIGEDGAIMSGAAILTGATGSNPWVYGSQTQAGTVTAGYGSGLSPYCSADPWLCRYPEEVYFDGVPLEPVEDAGAGGTGKFFFDYAADTIAIWDNPSGHVVETSVTPQAFDAGAATGVVLRNLTIEKYATPATTYAIVMGTGWEIDQCELRHCHYSPLQIADNAVVTNNYIHHNGAFGLNGSGADGLVEGNEIAYNNYWGHFSIGNGAGGSKFVFTDGLILRSNHAHHNNGPGLWTDINNINTLYEYNTCEYNQTEGIFHEVSYDAIIRYNNCNYNGTLQLFPGFVSGAGILVSASRNCEVHHNTCIDNWQGIAGYEPDRGGDVLENHGTWELVNFYVHHNTVQQLTDFGTNGTYGLSGVISTNPALTTFDYGVNRYRNNTYTFPGGGDDQFFNWEDEPRTLATWRTFGHDLAGPAAFVSHTSGGGSDSAATIVSTAQAHTAGNLLVVCCRWSKAGGVTVTGVTDTDGNTYAAANAVEQAFSDDSTNMQIWYALNIGGHATNVVTATLSGPVTFRWISVVEIQGAELQNALDDEAGAQDTTSPHVSGAFTTTQPDSVVCAWVSHGEVVADYAVGSGYQALSLTLGGGGFTYGAGMYRLYTDAQVGQTTQFTSSATQPGAVLLAAFTLAASVASAEATPQLVLVRAGGYL